MNLLYNYKSYNDVFNYVLLTPPYGKYHIKDDNIVVDILKSGISNNENIGLCEMFDENRNQISIIDLDIGLKEKKQISIDDIIPFIKLCNTIFSKYLNISKDLIYSYILAKNSFENNIEWKKDHLHFGLHIIYPEIILSLENKKHIYDIIVEECHKKSILGNLPLLHTNYKYIVDEGFTSKCPTMVYGSSKQNNTYYKLQYLVEFNLQIKDIVEEEERSFQDLYSIFKFNTDKPIVEADDSIFSCLPKTQYEIPRKKKINIINDEQSGVPLNEIIKLVDMLNIERTDKYDKWILLGLCLHNIDPSPEMMQVYQNASLKSETKSNKTDFKKLWKSFKRKNDGLNIGTLRYWASKDSPDDFFKFRNDEIDKKISLTIQEDGNTLYDIAKVLKELYSDVYICSNIAKNFWYEFKNHRWQRMDSGFKLFLNISDELVKYYKNKIKDIRKKEVQLDDDDEQNTVEEKREILIQKKNNIEKIIKQLKTTSFKKCLMEECRNLFYDSKFIENIDEISKNLVCFNNGVYDLDKLQFREGHPQDYISYTTGIDYIEHNNNSQDIERVYDILSQMHDSKEKTDYFLTTLAIALHGVKKEQRIDFWTGTGSNGKSLTVDFLQKSLGDYFYSPSITILTVKRKSSSNASPDIMKIKGRRYIVFQEPEQDDQIYTGLMKSLFGNDMICGRYLHENEISFKPQASGFLACNDLPNISSQDGGTWRRIKVLHFPYKFVLHEPVKEFEKKGDPNLPDEINNLKEAFVSLLVKYYKDHVILNNSKINEPKEVTDFTKQYRTSCDAYEEFVNDFICDSCEESNSKLEFNHIYEAIVHWNKEVNSFKTLPKKNDIKKQLENKFTKFINGKYWNNKKISYNFQK